MYEQLTLFTSDQTVVINAKKFSLKPEVHYSQVHNDMNDINIDVDDIKHNVDDIKQAKRMKSSVPIHSFFAKNQRNPQHSATATTSITSVTKPTPNIKSGSITIIIHKWLYGPYIEYQQSTDQRAGKVGTR